MHGPAVRRNLGIGRPQQRIVFAYRESMGDLAFFRLIRRTPIVAVPKHPFGGPGLHMTKLFRKSLRIRRGPERFNRQDSGSSMMTMGSAGSGVKAVDDDIGLEIPDYPHDIRQQFFPVPV